VQIPYFAANQNVVFLPALFALLAATVLVCLPIIFRPTLRRSKRRTPVLVLDGVILVVALIGTAWLAGVGFRTLGDERADLRAQLQQRYDVRLDAGQVGELIDGGKPPVTLPAVATAAGLTSPQQPHPLKLVPTAPGADTYDLTIGGKPWPTV
jgi:hypothetical protein